MQGNQRAASVWVLALAVLLSLGLCIAGGVREEFVVVALGVVGLVLVCCAGAVVFAGGGRGVAGAPSLDSIGELKSSIERFGEEMALSDDARRVLNRSRERALLCGAIEEDITNQDWDAAMVLVKELAERFGYRTEAEQFRGRIETARFETVERHVHDAISSLDGMLADRRWDAALMEAERITRLYPDSPRVEGLRHRVESARIGYKQDLERRFLNAAGDDQIEEAMELLREMDAYLTEAEAEPFKEVARGVIGRAKENLGVQFKLAVQDKQWRHAADVGERIIAEFPNTRMADEIRAVIDGIRDRASTLT